MGRGMHGGDGARRLIVVFRRRAGENDVPFSQHWRASQYAPLRVGHATLSGTGKLVVMKCGVSVGLQMRWIRLENHVQATWGGGRQKVVDTGDTPYMLYLRGDLKGDPFATGHRHG